MFEVRLMNGDRTLYVRHCDAGDILPTIATLLQTFEADHGRYTYQRPYAIQWRQVKE